MQALISTIEPRETGYRVAQVEHDENVFPVAEGFFWISCPVDVKKDEHWFDPTNKQFNPVPSIIQSDEASKA